MNTPSFLKNIGFATILSLTAQSTIYGCGGKQTPTPNTNEPNHPSISSKSKQDILHALGTDREKVVQESDGSYSIYACYDTLSDIPREDKDLPPNVQINRKIDHMIVDNKICKLAPNTIGLFNVKDVTVQELQSEIAHCIKRKAKITCNPDFF